MAIGTRAASTIVTYALSGSADFVVPFEYLARKFVVLTLIGAGTRQTLTLNTDYRFVNKTTVSLSNPSPAGFTTLEVRRSTSASERLVDFHDGSILRATDLNLSQVQTLHVAEEARDLTVDTLGVNDSGHLDARNRRIINLLAGVDAADAVTVAQLSQYDTSTLNNALRAEAARDVALAAEQNALTSKGASEVSASQALQSEENALISREAAQRAAATAQADASTSGSNANTAAAAANHALQYQNQALLYANEASAHADRAKTEADKLANTNAFAAAIESVDTTSHDVKMRGGWGVAGNLTVVGTANFNLQATFGSNDAIVKNGARDIGGGSIQNAGLFIAGDQSGGNQGYAQFVYQNTFGVWSGAGLYAGSPDGYSYGFQFRATGKFVAGSITTTAGASTFGDTVFIQHPTSGAGVSVTGQGDIVQVASPSIFATLGVGSLSAALNQTVKNISFGSQAILNQPASSWSAEYGAQSMFITGMAWYGTGGTGQYIQSLYARQLIITLSDGNRRLAAVEG